MRNNATWRVTITNINMKISASFPFPVKGSSTTLNAWPCGPNYPWFWGFEARGNDFSVGHKSVDSSIPLLRRFLLGFE